MVAGAAQADALDTDGAARVRDQHPGRYFMRNGVNGKPFVDFDGCRSPRRWRWWR
jgi:hypothetical protein